jgi:hypothetical protein
MVFEHNSICTETGAFVTVYQSLEAVIENLAVIKNLWVSRIERNKKQFEPKQRKNNWN